MDSIEAEGNMENRNCCIDEIVSKMACYELQENTSLLQHRLWLDTTARKSTNTGAGESLSSEAREACRIGSGANVVVPNILQLMIS